MAKGKNLNPADAARKAQRKKELKKNKAERTKVRDLATAKQDTSAFRAEIEELEAISQRNAKEDQRLSELKQEVEYIEKKKEEYVAEHPEQRKLIYRSNNTHARNDALGAPAKPKKERNYFDKNGIPRHPERSIYYDPVFNPYGSAPHGMPYIERPPLPGEVYSDMEDSSEDDVDEDDDITMPEGPPPEVSDDDDDIPMPEGPPPAKLNLFHIVEAPVAYPISLPTANLQPTNHIYPLHPGGASTQPSSGSGPSHTTNATSLSPYVGLPPPPPSLPAKPGTLMQATPVISAEPELRDLQKESTTFVPSSMRKKKAPGPKVTANPPVGENKDEELLRESRPNLLEAVRKQLETASN